MGRPSQRGVPDRLYFKSGELVIVEFKAPGKKPTPYQLPFTASSQVLTTLYTSSTTLTGKPCCVERNQPPPLPAAS